MKNGRSKGRLRAHSGSARPGQFPAEPSSQRELESVRSMMVSFEKLPKDERARLVEFSEYFCQNFSMESNCVWHRSTDTALKHLEALGRLGVPKNRTTLVDIATAGEAKEVTRKRRSEWERRLGLKGANWTVGEKRKSSKRLGSTVGIRVLQEAGKPKSSYAARYAMYLIRIAYADELNAPATAACQDDRAAGSGCPIDGWTRLDRMRRVMPNGRLVVAGCRSGYPYCRTDSHPAGVPVLEHPQVRARRNRHHHPFNRRLLRLHHYW